MPGLVASGTPCIYFFRRRGFSFTLKLNLKGLSLGPCPSFRIGDVARSLFLYYFRDNRGKKSLREFKGGVHGMILLGRYIAQITSDYFNKFNFVLVRSQWRDVFVCAVGGVRHPQHTQTSSNSSTTATDSSNGETNTRWCRYSCIRSWWWVEVPFETCRAVSRYK
jgi:hypothetical protein